MIENRHTVSESFEPLQASGAESLCVGPDLIDRQAETRAKRILLAEDQEPLRECLRMMLEQEGHQVTEASNGAEALKSFTIGEFDLVITDFDMPIMGGNRLAAGIKLLAPLLPILMITGSSSVRRDARNPVDALLNKPFTPTDLHWALTELLYNRAEPTQPSLSSAVGVLP